MSALTKTLPRIPVDAKEFGARLREIRKAKGWNQATGAELLDWDQPKMSDVERGAIRIKWPEDVLKICARWGVSVNQLLTLPRADEPHTGRGRPRKPDSDDE